VVKTRLNLDEFVSFSAGRPFVREAHTVTQNSR